MLRDIEIFRTVMNSGSASKAAALLGVSQPAVSQSLRKLEAKAGLLLFQRVRGRLQATPEAQALLVEVDRCFVGLESIAHRLTTLRNFGVGSLTVASYPALGMGFLPRTIARHQDAHPRTAISLQIMSSTDVRERVLSAQCDLGLMADEASTLGLEHSVFAKAAGVVVMRRDHKLARKKIIEPQDLVGMPFVSLNPEDAARQRLEVKLSAAGVQLATVVHTPYAITVCELALRGVGVGIVFPVAALDFIERGLVMRRFGLDVEFTSHLAFTPGRPLSNEVKQFLTSMRKQLAEDLARVAQLLK